MLPVSPEFKELLGDLPFYVSQAASAVAGLTSVVYVAAAATPSSIPVDKALAGVLATAIGTGGKWLYNMNRWAQLDRQRLWARIAQLETVLHERGLEVPPPIHNPEAPPKEDQS